LLKFENIQKKRKKQNTDNERKMFKLLREISRTDAYGFPAAFDDEKSSSFSGFSESKSCVTIKRRATIRDVNDQWNRKTQVLTPDFSLHSNF